MFVMAQDLVCVGQPIQEIRILVRHYNPDILSLSRKIICPRKGSANSIAVGVDMPYEDYVSSGGDI